MITHDEVFSLRNGQPATSIRCINIWLFVSVTVDIQISVTDFNRISRQTHNPFDEIGIAPARIAADYNIKALRIPPVVIRGAFSLDSASCHGKDSQTEA